MSDHVQDKYCSVRSDIMLVSKNAFVQLWVNNIVDS